jgi:DNA-binding MarR family transcriptional regulator
MAKKRAAKTATKKSSGKKTEKPSAGKKRKATAITPSLREVLNYLSNNVAIGDYDRCCSIEAIAKHLKKQPARMERVVRQLADMGLARIEESVLPTVYPTVAGIRAENKSITESQAKVAIQRAKKR